MARANLQGCAPGKASQGVMTHAESMFGAESSDEFARIDLISNHTVFQDPQHYRALLRGEALPVETYSSFIHEATHHWCFISPVGTALSLLYLSVAKKALHWAATGDDSKLNEALDDLCAFQIAVSWLHPLSEGLAQFAEYDVLPPTSGSLISPPTLATLLHLFNMRGRFDGASQHDPRPAQYKLTNDITRWRLSPRTIDRKSNLLLQPIEAEGSGYLLGYLTVKQLWRSATRFYDELKDADLFMMLLRKFVYGDYALIADLLNRNQQGFQRGLRFSKGLYDRLYAVRMMFFDEDVPWSEWEQLLATPPTEQDISIFGVADTPFAAIDTVEIAQKGREFTRQYFREVVTELIDWQFEGTPHRFPPDFFLDVLKERRLMWLADVPAKWVSTGPRKGRILVDGEVFIDNYDLTNTPEEEFDDLRLDMYVDLYEKYQVTTIASAGGVFGFASRDAPEGVLQRLAKIRMDRTQIVVFTDMIHDLVHTYMARTNFPSAMDEFWTKKGGLGHLNRTYMQFAFNANDAAMSTFAKPGLAKILGDDADLVRSVAAISLAASAGLSPEGFEMSAPVLPLKPLDTIRRVEKLWQVDKFPLVRIGDDGFLDSAL